MEPMRGDYTALAGCHRHSKCSESKRGVAFYNQQIPPSGGLSTLTTSVTVTGGNVAQIPATKHLYAREQRQERCTVENGLTGESRVCEERGIA